MVSGVALFFSASSVFIHVQMSLDDIFEATRRHRNGFIGMLLRRAVAFAAIVGIGLLVTASVLANLAVQTLDHLVLHGGSPTNGSRVRYLLSAASWPSPCC